MTWRDTTDGLIHDQVEAICPSTHLWHCCRKSRSTSICKCACFANQKSSETKGNKYLVFRAECSRHGQNMKHRIILHLTYSGYAVAFMDLQLFE